MEDEEFEPACADCNHFFPASDGPTVYGICLNDPVFEPYLDELLENQNYDCCKKLIEQKKFDCNNAPCPDFEPAEITNLGEIDDDSELAKVLRNGFERGKFDKAALENGILTDLVNQINWKEMAVEPLEQKLKSANPEERDSAINTLIYLLYNNNEAAKRMILLYFNELPPPKTLEEVHFHKDLLRRLDVSQLRQELPEVLIKKLYQTPSNGTTRQWISEIFKVLKSSATEEMIEPLEEMLKDKRFSYRLKQKIKKILSICYGDDWDDMAEW